MMFFIGLHQPSDMRRISAAFVSVNRLRNRRKLNCQRWIMDSGAFTTLLMHGDYPEKPEAYAAEIRRWSKTPGLLAAVTQDWMCEPFMLERTGLTVAEHQRRTIERYDQLLAAGTNGVRVLPVLQGFTSAEYVDHIRQYGDRLRHRAWVGVGSLCKRNGRVALIEDVLLAINRERPDLRLHGFGLKTTALGSGLVRGLLFSADSMAWSYSARKQGRNGNDWREAARFGRRIKTMPVQHSLLGL